jgi:hypothetical protein
VEGEGLRRSILRLEVRDVAKTLEVQIEVPDTVSDEVLEEIRAKTRQTMVLMLQQQGELTIR